MQSPENSSGELDIAAIIPASGSDEEIAQVVQYLTLREQGLSMEATAEAMNTSRRTLYRMVKDWTDSRLLDDARRALLILKNEEINAVVQEVLNDWPKVVRYALKVATGEEGQSREALKAAAWLKETVIDPALEKRPEANPMEAQYLELHTPQGE